MARAVITAGGIGTIVAVLLVLFFLLAVTFPLFRPARLDASVAIAPAADAAEAADAIVAIGCDDSGAVGWLLERGGGVRIVSLASGSLLAELDAETTGLEGVVAMRPLADRLDAVVGFADGSCGIARVGLEATFLAEADLPPGTGPLEAGGAVADEQGVILRRPGGRYARLAFCCEPPARDAEGKAAVVDVDGTQLPSGPLFAVLREDGSVRVELISRRRNLLTDEMISSSQSVDLPAEDSAGGSKAPPRFVRVSELGDQVYVIDADGSARRYSLRDLDDPQFMEEADLTAGSRVTAVARLYGGNSLAVGREDGSVGIWFLVRSDDAAADGLRLSEPRQFPPPRPAAAITALAASPRSRLLAAGDAAGGLRLLHSTTGNSLLVLQSASDRTLPGPARQLAIAATERRLLAADTDAAAAWAFDPGYPEVSPAALFGQVWYENYPGPTHAWETTGHESFEPKYGLVPLVFGTIKATVYSMLFAVPIAILAAIYSSQFMHPAWKARIKPAIETMASLPSVVLGFVAGLVFAPIIEGSVVEVVCCFFTVPLALVAAAHVWQFLPAASRNRRDGWRVAAVLLVVIPAGMAAAWLAGPVVETILFDGDFRAWLDGHGGSGLGGWVFALLPPCGVAAAVLSRRIVAPFLRRRAAGWSPRQAAMVSTASFLVGVAATLALAVAAAMLLDALRFDTRGGLFGTYVQRNAMIVAFGMSFAIIPLIFTIADDALSSVPEHLRSASLGAGATPWQTAVRVIVPAAASGLFSAAMIGLGRAVGETMIVLMAAGNTPLLKWNIFNGFQTLSAALATELPEAARGSTHYRVLFLAALTLFAMTFLVNTVAELVRQRVRRRSHEL